MKLVVNKTHLLTGQATPPSSKSHSIRAILLAAMCEGESVLTNLLHSDDVDDAMQACERLGVIFTETKNEMKITSRGLPFHFFAHEICSGNSGITTHFIMPMLGLRQNVNQSVILNCKAQMRERPIASLVNALKNLGLTIEYLNNENKFPIKISGKLVGGKTKVDGITSQYLSALLFTLPCAGNDSEIIIENLQERSYVEMTLNWLATQHIQFNHIAKGNNDIYQIKGQQKYTPFEATIPGDFSSASYLIAAAVLIPGEIKLVGLNMTDAQGDKRLIALLQEMGADIFVESTYIRVKGGKKLTGIQIEANDIPDLLPVLAVVGTRASGVTQIVNVAHARIKETDRLHSMTVGLRSMGAAIEEKVDGLIIHESQLKGAHVKGFGDHRTVMALSVAGDDCRGYDGD